MQIVSYNGKQRQNQIELRSHFATFLSGFVSAISRIRFDFGIFGFRNVMVYIVHSGIKNPGAIVLSIPNFQSQPHIFHIKIGISVMKFHAFLSNDLWLTEI